MSDDIVTRLRKEVVKAEIAGILPSWEFAKTIWEAADEIERLRGQVKAAHKILGSESFGWLVIGSEHEVAHWKTLSPHIDEYWDKYGTYFRPKPVA